MNTVTRNVLLRGMVSKERAKRVAMAMFFLGSIFGACVAAVLAHIV